MRVFKASGFINPESLYFGTKGGFLPIHPGFPKKAKLPKPAPEKTLAIKRHARIAIIDPSRGVLVVAKRGHPFNLPGGKAKKNESLKSTVVRERRQEIGKNVKIAGVQWHSDHLIKKGRKGEPAPEFHKVFVAQLKQNGHPEPHHEVKRMKWVNLKNLGRAKLAAPADFVVPMLLGKRWKKRKIK